MSEKPTKPRPHFECSTVERLADALGMAQSDLNAMIEPSQSGYSSDARRERVIVTADVPTVLRRLKDVQAHVDYAIRLAELLYEDREFQAKGDK